MTSSMAARQLGFEPYASSSPVELRKHRSDREKLYRVKVTQGGSSRTTQIRRSVSDYLVSYENLTPTLQRLNQRGCRVVDVSPA
jgi:hypothetical protein